MGRKNRRKHYNTNNTYGGMEKMLYTNEQAKQILARPSELQWFSHTASVKRHSDRDISITANRQGERASARFNIIFRNGTACHFPGRVDIAVMKNRVFFKVADDGVGYKFYTAKRANPMLQLTSNAVSEVLKDFVGDYDLKYDEFYELYYIEKES